MTFTVKIFSFLHNAKFHLFLLTYECVLKKASLIQFSCTVITNEVSSSLRKSYKEAYGISGDPEAHRDTVQEGSVYGIVIIPLFYQKIINMSNKDFRHGLPHGGGGIELWTL